MSETDFDRGFWERDDRVPHLHYGQYHGRRHINGPGSYSMDKYQDIIEAWSEGFHVGSLIILILIVICNYRRGVLLHKLILLEVSGHLMSLDPQNPDINTGGSTANRLSTVVACGSAWNVHFHGGSLLRTVRTSPSRLPILEMLTQRLYSYVSSTGILMYVSYSIHNLVSWMKIKPFLPRWGGRFFIISLAIVQPYWVVEMWANYEFYNSGGTNTVFATTRYCEPLFRDPWWIFTTLYLCVAIKKGYELTFKQLFQASPRFAVMLLCMFLSVVFLVTDVAVTFKASAMQHGMNPFWRVSFFISDLFISTEIRK